MEKIKQEKSTRGKEKVNVANLYSQWKEIMFNSQNFFSNLNPKEKYRGATKYFLQIQAIATGLLFLFILSMTYSDPEFATLTGVSGGELFLSGLLISILVFPLALLLSWGMLYVNAGILHLFVLMFGGTQGYAQTFRSITYSVSPNIFAIIPFVGWAGGVYSIVLQITAIKHLQKLNWAKSIAAVIVPMALIISIVLIIYLKIILPFILAGGIL